MMSASSCSISRRVSLMAVPRCIVAAADAHQLERVAVVRLGPSVTRLVRVLRLGAGELRHRRDGTGHVLVVEGAERALHSESTAILIGVPLPPVSCLTAAYPGGASVGAASSEAASPPPPPSSSSSPQPANASAAIPRRSASHIRPRLRFPTSDIACLPPLAVDSCPGGVVLRARERRCSTLTCRHSAGRTSFPGRLTRAGRTAQPPDRPLPQADQAEGEQRAMTRKINPISVWNRSATKPTSCA